MRTSNLTPAQQVINEQRRLKKFKESVKRWIAASGNLHLVEHLKFDGVISEAEHLEWRQLAEKATDDG